MNWLSTRTDRERYLIYGMLVLLALFVGWQFVIKPVFETRQKADAAFISAERDLNIVRSGLSSLGPAPSANLSPFDRSVAVQVSREAGLIISRVQPNSDGSLQLWFDGSSSAQIYDFLTRLTASYSVEIKRVQMSKGQEGLVTSQITLTSI